METSVVLRPVLTDTALDHYYLLPMPAAGPVFRYFTMPGETVSISGAWFLTGTPTKTRRVIKHWNSTVGIAGHCFVRELHV